MRFAAVSGGVRSHLQSTGPACPSHVPCIYSAALCGQRRGDPSILRQLVSWRVCNELICYLVDSNAMLPSVRLGRSKLTPSASVSPPPRKSAVLVERFLICAARAKQLALLQDGKGNRTHSPDQGHWVCASATAAVYEPKSTALPRSVLPLSWTRATEVAQPPSSSPSVMYHGGRLERTLSISIALWQVQEKGL